MQLDEIADCWCKKQNKFPSDFDSVLSRAASWTASCAASCVASCAASCAASRKGTQTGRSAGVGGTQPAAQPAAQPTAEPAADPAAEPAPEPDANAVPDLSPIFQPLEGSFSAVSTPIFATKYYSTNIFWDLQKSLHLCIPRSWKSQQNIIKLFRICVQIIFAENHNLSIIFIEISTDSDENFLEVRWTL